MDEHGSPEIFKYLKVWEQISIVFLLCKTSLSGIDMIDRLISHHTEDGIGFIDWFKKEGCYEDGIGWSGSFIEALSVIQNFKVGVLLGYNKEELMAKYLPNMGVKTVAISPLRKTLYRLCESLTKAETSDLVKAIQMEFNLHRTNTECDLYLEFYLLKWDSLNILSFCNTERHDLKTLMEQSTYKTKAYFDEISTVLYTAEPFDFKDEFYKVIDINNIGYCVIINEKNFHKSDIPEYKSLLPDHNLQSRGGTEKDVDKLKTVFTAFGFQVKIYNDVKYKELVNILGFYSQEISRQHSFFVLVILSHGSENVIYTCDSIPVSIDTIELVFQGKNCPSLIGKPKIFVIQSCQGEEWQQIQVDTAKVSLESPPITERTMGPERGDSVIAWSTVKGFASFRDKYNGSWFIQEFCDKLMKHGDTKDLVDIFTSVNNSLRGKTYQGQFMIPWLSLSVCKKIRFHRIQTTLSG